MSSSTTTFLGTWLLSNIVKDSSGDIKSDELLWRYQSYDSSAKSTVIGTLGRTMKQLFPYMTVSPSSVTGKISGKKVSVYKGVSWSEIDDAVADEIQWAELPDIIPRTAICLKENVPHIHTVLIPTQYVTNGNTIMKRINFCQKTLTWQLTIRGKIINIGNLGLDNSFSLSAKSVHRIIDAVDKIIICTGLLTEKDEEFVQKFQNKEFVKEFISVGGDENTGEMRVRSQSGCTQVRSWCLRFSMNKGACRNCQIDCCKYRAFITGLKKITVLEQNSTTDETEQNGNLIQLEDRDHTDMSVIMDKVFPNAPVEMKVLLKAQYGALRAKTKQSRHWDKQMISICLSLWVRSPKAYADLSDSKMLILPSGRQLRRYKNFIPQKSGICDQVLEWMMEAAKEAKVPSHGWAGGLHHDETKLQQDLVLSMRGGTGKGRKSESKGRTGRNVADAELTDEAGTAKQSTKGKQLKRKSRTESKATAKISKVQYPCGTCEKECDSECVACDLCDRWFHLDCVKCTVEDVEEIDWFCTTCKPG